jgi:DNA invertase Pin-like site-specific DNA recombinase
MVTHRAYKDENSGRATTRPAYRQMMADMDSWDILLVVKQDRIHRNVRNIYEMVDELRAKGKWFASVEESIDTTTAAAGRSSASRTAGPGLNP